MRIHEMSEQEVLNLTDEQIERLIDLECADNGVPLLPEEPKEPMRPNVHPDMIIYKVGGFEFTDADEARKVAEMVGGCRSLCEVDYARGSGMYQRIYKGPATGDDLPKVTSEKIYTPEHFSKYRKDLEAHQEAKAAYDRVKKEYDSIVGARRGLAEDVWERVQEVREKESRRQFLMRQLERYEELANGDRRVALNFLHNAYPDARNWNDFEFPPEEAKPDDEHEKGAAAAQAATR